MTGLLEPPSKRGNHHADLRNQVLVLTSEEAHDGTRAADYQYAFPPEGACVSTEQTLKNTAGGCTRPKTVPEMASLRNASILYMIINNRSLRTAVIKCGRINHQRSINAMESYDGVVLIVCAGERKSEYRCGAIRGSDSRCMRRKIMVALDAHVVAQNRELWVLPGFRQQTSALICRKQPPIALALGRDSRWQ